VILLRWKYGYRYRPFSVKRSNVSFRLSACEVAVGKNENASKIVGALTAASVLAAPTKERMRTRKMISAELVLNCFTCAQQANVQSTDHMLESFLVYRYMQPLPWDARNFFSVTYSHTHARGHRECVIISCEGTQTTVEPCIHGMYSYLRYVAFAGLALFIFIFIFFPMRACCVFRRPAAAGRRLGDGGAKVATRKEKVRCVERSG
jgi:hypothetical protein